MIELKYFEDEISRKFMIIDNEQGKKIEVLYHNGITDYFISGELLANGQVDDDKNISFIIDKTNIDLYEVFSNFFEATKKVALELKMDKKEVDIPPLKVKSVKEYDIYDLYNEKQNQIKWVSDQDTPMFNNFTEMYIEKQDEQLKITFSNEEIAKINERYDRLVRVRMSGSRSTVFPYLFGSLFKDLKSKVIIATNEKSKVLVKKSK